MSHCVCCEWNDEQPFTVQRVVTLFGLNAGSKARTMNVRLRTPSLWLFLLLVSGCGEAPPPAPPPPEVTVLTVATQSLDNVFEVPGRVQARRIAEVRARVDGIVQRRVYEEGSDVSAGQELFLIDPSELKASLSAVNAVLVRAQATAANAAQDVKRYEGLVEDEAISQQEYDAALARLRTAEADVAQAEAQRESAQLALNYAVVTAPIRGRAGRAQVTEGALVSAASATLLTTIEQVDPVYVNFSQSSSDLLTVRRQISSGELKIPELTRVAARLILEDGSPYPHQGHLDFLDLSIDEETGTAAVRAEFPNPDRVLLPGQFVSARIEAGVRPQGLLVPQRAVQLTADAATVMTLDDKNVVVPKQVRLGELRQGSWIVLSGLANGERVIVDGLQKVRPGQPVQIASAATAGAQTQAQPETPAKPER